MALVLVAAGAVFWNRPEPTAKAAAVHTAPSKAPRVAEVSYEVSGRGHVTIQYFDPARNASVMLTDPPLPWRVDLPAHAVSFVQVTARRMATDPDGTHPVRALVDGIPVCAGTDETGYMQSDCMELVAPQ